MAEAGENHGGKNGDGGGWAGYRRGFPRNLEEGETLVETDFSKRCPLLELPPQTPEESLPPALGILCLMLPVRPSSDHLVAGSCTKVGLTH